MKQVIELGDNCPYCTLSHLSGPKQTTSFKGKWLWCMGMQRKGNKIANKNISYIYLSGGCAHAVTHMWKLGDNLRELVVSYLLWSLNSACQAWQRAPLPAEPSHMTQVTKALEDAQPCLWLG